METRTENKKMQEVIQTIYKIRSSVNKSINIKQLENCKNYYSIFVSFYGVRSQKLEKNIIEKNKFLIIQYQLN